MASAPSILNVHTPSESFAIVHSITQESLEALYDKLTRKASTTYRGQRVGPGWLKYEFNDSIWNLDDDSDYTIFVWRQKNEPPDLSASVSSVSSATDIPATTPTLHLHSPSLPLPTPPAYRNTAYYQFHPSRSGLLHPPTTRLAPRNGSSRGSIQSRRSKASATTSIGPETIKKDFERFHSENGVRTVTGNIGPVKGVRMLLKSGYRHVYIRREFAIVNGFIAADSAPGYGGYTGLVNIGQWPITLTTADSVVSNAPRKSLGNGAGSASVRSKKSIKKLAWDPELHGTDPVMMAVYLSEEPHFDVVLGRAFFEKRQIQVDPVNLTDVVCLDTGEKIECDVIILKDGRGEIVTVT
ncbi:hypothetical protein CYLTODRAFT_400654 [Cylindrobasidium torrendii FP15055 ss-10]|uniref:Uncharacterized protein n=1 Tax=Cylindrobasidium torrendii FP15055 ss-10 TaxID=1314674 RepID=A0A0D7B475_9AGAR|nr:hypothetical protein CYLTODRAFT_400654 [Cylindrobasidium torrendii FP15055 ss-10]